MKGFRIIPFAACAFAATLGTQACDDWGIGPGDSDGGPDRTVLMKLYHATNGPEWTNNDGWGTDAPLNRWYGVVTDGTGRVLSLNLGGTLGANGLWQRHGLVGPIPPELGDLTSLSMLSLEGNDLQGPIPPELGKLSNLSLLDLGDNSLTGPIPPELGDLTELTELALPDNELTGAIPVALTNLSNLRRLDLAQNDLSGEIPVALVDVSSLQELVLFSNDLSGGIPVELAEMANLTALSLGSNDLVGTIPPQLADLEALDWLSLSYNHLTGTIPPELGNLTNLTGLFLQGNNLEGGIPAELGSLANLEWLYLARNALSGPIPAELGNLAGMTILWLSENELTGAIPPELGNLRNATYLGLYRNALTGPIPPELGGLAAMERLFLYENDLEGPVPPEFGAMVRLRQLGLTNNAALEGPLPTELIALGQLEGLLAGGTALCAPDDPALTSWLEGVRKRRIALCSGGSHQAYLIQSVQSRAFPVPLVAGEEALLRVFVTAPAPVDAGIPPIRARFFHNGTQIHVKDIAGNSRTIPTEVDESSLMNSSNAVIPGDVVQPGLEMVIEVDPQGTLDPELGVTERIPETGRLPIEVGNMPLFDLTLVPFLWKEAPKIAIVGTVGSMAADPENHELLWETRTLLPVGELDVTAHAPVSTSSNNSLDLLRETSAIRVVEGGTGHYMGMMSRPVTGFAGMAWIPGRSSFSVADAELIAHELGHNFSLNHAPCGGPASPDAAFPDPDGSIAVWGYDARGAGRLMAPARADIMSYCKPVWISDYHFTNALRFRLSDADSVGLPMVTPSTQALLLWGGADADGVPFLEPVFVVDAPPELPRSSGGFRLAGRTDDGVELFSLSFAMPEAADGDGSSGFAFALPVEAGWAGTLSVITLSGPGGSVAVDGESDLPMAVLRDSRTGQVRAMLRDLPGTVLTRSDAVAALSPEPGIEVLFSRGIPPVDSWRR
ncbi:MAG: hypothetical protein OXL34_02695 [Gemmatimonadota bacterium]|nr:hypothetical protein [Gemmatimonadota bacterium]